MVHKRVIHSILLLLMLLLLGMIVYSLQYLLLGLILRHLILLILLPAIPLALLDELVLQPQPVLRDLPDEPDEPCSPHNVCMTRTAVDSDIDRMGLLHQLQTLRIVLLLELVINNYC